jgi:hypothetical protein
MKGFLPRSRSSLEILLETLLKFLIGLD